MPYAGIGRAYRTISRALLFSRRDPLKRALRAGALCEVVEDDITNNPHEDDVPADGRYEKTFTPDDRKIHRRVILHEPYKFKVILNDIESDNTYLSNHLSTDYGIAKAIVGLIQLGFAAFTLYRSVGNEIEIYGYAAPGLTVSQYAVMTMVNLLANLASPQY